MSKTGVQEVAPRRHLSDRRARTVDRLVEATVAELADVGYQGLTVRGVAKRSGVASATAYTYFASKDHLVAEVFWRRISAHPRRTVDRRRSPANRVTDVLLDYALVVADETDLAAACTVALLADEPEVHELRIRIGRSLHERLLDALAGDADPAVARTLELLVSGALIQVGTGHLAYRDLPDLLGDSARLVLGDGVVTAATGLVYDPYAYEIHEDPYPTYARLRDEAPVYRNDERAFWALSRHADVMAAFRDTERFSNRHGVSIDPAASGPGAHRTMSFLAMDPPDHGRMRGLVSRGFTPRRVAGHGGRHPGADRRLTSTTAWPRGRRPSTSWPTSPARCRWT